MSEMTPQNPAAPETETDANGLTEAERKALWEATDRAYVDTTTWDHEVESEVERAVERIVAERVRVVEGERDAARAQIRDREANGAEKRAETAEAAHEAEKAAHERLRVIAESIAYEHAATVDGEFGCCHDEDALRAGGRVAEFDGDEFEPIPPDCLGWKTVDRHLALLGGGGAR